MYKSTCKPYHHQLSRLRGDHLVHTHDSTYDVSFRSLQRVIIHGILINARQSVASDFSTYSYLDLCTLQKYNNV